MEYLLKSSAILIIFYLFYKLFLQKETFFEKIRFYFLTGLFASLLLPLIVIPEYVNITPVNLPAQIQQTQTEQNIPETIFNWEQLLMIVYLTGVALFLFRFLFRLISVIHFISSHKKVKYNNYYIIKTHKNISPFSFFNYIVFNDANYSKNELEQILNHEKIHVKQFHSFDNLLSQIVSIIFWFNPFSWLYSKEIMKNLEFIADEKTQYLVKEKKTYQYLLLKTSSPEFNPALTSNFYNSLIKKRIDMLQKERSQKFMQLKFTLILPVLIAFIFTFNTKVIAQKKDGYTVKVFTDRIDNYEFITKDTKNYELEKMKEDFKNYGTQFKYKKLKRNAKGEITGISISVKNKFGNEAKISQSSNQPISAIMIRDDIKNGELSIGNVSDKDKTPYKMFLREKNKDKTSSNHTKHTNSFTTNDDGTEIYVVNGDKNSAKTSSNFVTLSDKKGKKKKYIFTVNSDGTELINTGDQDMKIWISTNKDTTRVKRIKIVPANGKVKLEANEITIKQGNLSKEGNVFIFKSDDEINASNDKQKMIYSTSGKKPLFFLDKKEITEKEMNAIKPENIESINVLKGKTAVDKYGEKAKNGVIEITSKK